MKRITMLALVLFVALFAAGTAFAQQPAPPAVADANYDEHIAYLRPGGSPMLTPAEVAACFPERVATGGPLTSLEVTELLSGEVCSQYQGRFNQAMGMLAFGNDHGDPHFRATVMDRLARGEVRSETIQGNNCRYGLMNGEMSFVRDCSYDWNRPMTYWSASLKRVMSTSGPMVPVGFDAETIVVEPVEITTGPYAGKMASLVVIVDFHMPEGKEDVPGCLNLTMIITDKVDAPVAVPEPEAEPLPVVAVPDPEPVVVPPPPAPVVAPQPEPAITGARITPRVEHVPAPRLTDVNFLKKYVNKDGECVAIPDNSVAEFEGATSTASYTARLVGTRSVAELDPKGNIKNCEVQVYQFEDVELGVGPSQVELAILETGVPDNSRDVTQMLRVALTDLNGAMLETDSVPNQYVNEFSKKRRGVMTYVVIAAIGVGSAITIHHFTKPDDVPAPECDPTKEKCGIGGGPPPLYAVAGSGFGVNIGGFRVGVGVGSFGGRRD